MKKWYLPEFDFTFYLTLDPSLKEIKDKEVRLKFEEDLGKSTECGGICHENKDLTAAYILIVPDKEIDFPILVDIVAHEVFHAIGFLYKSIEDETQIQTVTEVPAYYQGWLTGEIIRALGYV